MMMADASASKSLKDMTLASFIVVCLSEILRAGSRDDPLRTHLEKGLFIVFY